MPGYDRPSQRTEGWVDWPGVLDEHDVRFLALDTQEDSALFQIFQSHPEWTLDTEDGGAVLLAHSHAVHGDHSQAGPWITSRLAA
jgi:hypothetical protein